MYRDAAVREGEPMSSHTSMKVGGNADYYIMPRSEQTLIDVLDVLGEQGIPYFLVGGGTNVIVRDGGFRGAVVAVGKGLDAVDIDEGRGIVTAGAGAALSAVAKKAAKAGLSGLEPMSGIPGTVGGAMYMNAGSYGSDMSRIAIQARAYDSVTRNIRAMSLYELRLGYRSSVFQARGEYAILSATFRLRKRSASAINSAMRDFAKRRREKQPMDVPSAGSFFKRPMADALGADGFFRNPLDVPSAYSPLKRPEGVYAGELVERAGLKGVGVGGARVSEMHAGFIVNEGGASASDVLALMAKVQETVKADSGYFLEPEPCIIGEDR
jgi:UDP-N-acetylmuramate dehydrogenase